MGFTMSDTDIYKKREAMPMGKTPQKKQRRQRSKSRRAFDDHSKQRRSKNSGLRRFLHLARKSKNEKLIWGAVGILLVIVLVIIGIWQFVISEYLIRQQESESQYIEYQPHIPEAAQDGGSQSGRAPLIK
jgi:hypothetical protein